MHTAGTASRTNRPGLAGEHLRRLRGHDSVSYSESVRRTDWARIPVRAAVVALVTLVALSTGGCVTETVAPAAQQQQPLSKKPDRPAVKPSKIQTPEASASANTDPCAMRLHDICGALLTYYLAHQELPPTLDMLKEMSVEEAAVLTCPVSDKPYTYNINAIIRPEQADRIIAYDATPSHKGFRWAISLADPKPGEPLVMKVIAMPEAAFRFVK